MEQKAFVLGMITAFCECVAGGCKRLALSPPLTAEIFEEVRDSACEIIRKHGLLYAIEENLDMPEDRRFTWILIARREETLEGYRKLRAAGFQPWESLKPFSELLSYNPAEAVSTGYDAYLTFFSINP